jgi:membrane protein DedA with SNARE-associated domain
LSFTDVFHQLVQLVREHQSLAAPIVFLVGMAESIPIVSFFVPSSLLFVGIGAVHASAGGHFSQVWVAGALGATAGDSLAYLLGRIFEHRIQHVWPLSQHPQWWAKGHDFFEKWGIMGVATGKFLGPMRSAVAIIAGILEMPYRYFFIASLVSSMLWAALWLAPGAFGLEWFLE